MRWPFGPPHLTLKPSKKKHKNKKNRKKNQKKSQKRKPKKKQQKYQKIAFQLSVNFFPFFWGGFSKIPFFTPWPKKTEPK